MARSGSFAGRLGSIAAWAVSLPSRRVFFARRNMREVELASEDGVVLRAWLYEVEDARGTVVVGHGYRDDRRQLASLAPALAALKLRTLLLDFRAHGRSEGRRITIGLEEARDVRAALTWASTLSGHVSYVGFSMGAAAYLLSGREAHAAVIDSPYDALTEAIAVRARFVRAGDALVSAFREANELRTEIAIESVRPIAAVPALTAPTLFLFARGDAWIPEATRARFRAALSPSCEYDEVDGGHDSHFDTGWIVRVARFLDRHA